MELNIIKILRAIIPRGLLFIVNISEEFELLYSSGLTNRKNCGLRSQLKYRSWKHPNYELEQETNLQSIQVSLKC